ncbi:MAG TPA: hypothetical protein VGS16_17585 [Candidatus Dormibacteraeota bacterium]|nr:hypothetical protein [Candidatus Dormibacteraeota bacterium]
MNYYMSRLVGIGDVLTHSPLPPHKDDKRGVVFMLNPPGDSVPTVLEKPAVLVFMGVSVSPIRE